MSLAPAPPAVPTDATRPDAVGRPASSGGRPTAALAPGGPARPARAGGTPPAGAAGPGAAATGAGRYVPAWLTDLGPPVAYFGEVLLSVGATLSGRQRVSRRDAARVAADVSARALLLVLGVNLLVGAILAFVGAVQLVQFGAGIFVADLVAIAVSREMAAVITAVVMCGRTGAAFAAELATMQTNEEIDALRVLGVDPVPFLVLPRVVALTLILPLLYGYACAAGLAGGLLVGAAMLDLAPGAYLERTVGILGPTHLGLGFVKSFVFGAWIALAGCWCGLQAERNAAGVGRATTRAVVLGIVGVIVLDSLAAIIADALSI